MLKKGQGRPTPSPPLVTRLHFYKNTLTKMKIWKITLKKRDDTSFTESEFSSANINFKRVLGVEWDTESDSFGFQFDDLIKLAKSLKPTKRI